MCVFQSPMWTRSGYGDLAIALAKSLYRYDKFDLHVVPTRWGGCSRKYLAEDITDPIEQELYRKIVRAPINKQPEVFIQCSIPNEFQGPAKYNIGVTAGIETTLARADWVEGLNRMNSNLVTSKHAKDVFQSAIYSKIDEKTKQVIPGQDLKSVKPMETLFWGVDTTIYGKDKPAEPKVDAEMEAIKEDFNFLFVGQWTGGNLFGDRKDIGNLIKTFLTTFSNLGAKPKPGLIIKTSGAAICNMDKYDMITRLKTLKEFVGRELGTTDLPNVYLLYGELTEPEMNALYNHPKIRAHVSFTHGEGFGMPLLMASFSGKPILASNWSGHLDFLDSRYCKLLDGEVKPLPADCVNEWLIKDSSWFTVDYIKAGEAMKNCFHYYRPFLDKAEELRVQNETNFSTQAMDTKFWAFLDANVPKFATEQKLILPKLKKVVKPISPPVETPKIQQLISIQVENDDRIDNVSLDKLLEFSNSLQGKEIKLSRYKNGEGLKMEKIKFNINEPIERIKINLEETYKNL